MNLIVGDSWDIQQFMFFFILKNQILKWVGFL